LHRERFRQPDADTLLTAEQLEQQALLGVVGHAG